MTRRLAITRPQCFSFAWQLGAIEILSIVIVSVRFHFLGSTTSHLILKRVRAEVMVRVRVRLVNSNWVKFRVWIRVSMEQYSLLSLHYMTYNND